MKVLITGSNGFLGSTFVNNYQYHFRIICTSLHKTLHDVKIKFIPGDLLDEQFIKSLIIDIKPDVVINTVANVNLDSCEKDKQNAQKINVQTAINLSKSLNENIHLIHISTDHLFNGKKSFYKESDTPNPLNIYASTKLNAEKECLNIHKKTSVIRTNIIGWSPSNHNDTFIEWIFNNLTSGKSINLFYDYYFTPIEVNLFSKALLEIIHKNLYGIFNICGSERCSKYSFGLQMADLFNLDKSLINKSSLKSYSFTAPRPSDLSLSIQKFNNLTKYSLPNLNENLISLQNRSY